MLTSFKCDHRGLGDKGHARRKDKVSTTSNLISHMQRRKRRERERDPSWRYSILVRMSKCRSSYLGFRPYVSSSTTGTGCLRNFGIFSTVLGIRNHPIILTSMRIYFENLYRMIEFKIEMKWRGKGEPSGVFQALAASFSISLVTFHAAAL